MLDHMVTITLKIYSRRIIMFSIIYTMINVFKIANVSGYFIKSQTQRYTRQNIILWILNHDKDIKSFL